MLLKTRAILVVVIGTILGVGLSVGGGILQQERVLTSEELALDHARLFSEVMERVKQDYVDPVDDATLMESAIRGMVAELDRHSAYLDSSEYEDVRISASGTYSGVGLELSTSDNSILVVSPIEGTPAHAAGILSGDEIVAIDDLAVDDDGLDETIGRMRGPAGSSVSLTVMRDALTEPMVFQLTRKKIQLLSVRHQVIEPAYGYLRISQFNDATVHEAQRALDEMMDSVQASTGSTIVGLILDLRNNPGGILDAAVGVSDLFLDNGNIVSARGRTTDASFSHEAHAGDILDGAPIVVLVNRGSASASEIVAGALQDHDRAIVIGTTTFGKGLVQTVMPLSRGRAVKLTTSRYYTPSGDSIHETGVSPDIVIESSGRFPGQSMQAAVDREGDEQLMEGINYLRSQRIVQSQAVD